MAAKDQHAGRPRDPLRLLSHPGLADPGLAGKQGEGPLPLARPLDHVGDALKLPGAAHQGQPVAGGGGGKQLGDRRDQARVRIGRRKIDRLDSAERQRGLHDLERHRHQYAF